MYRWEIDRRCGSRQKDAPRNVILYRMIDEMSNRYKKAAQGLPFNRLPDGSLQSTGTVRRHVTPRAMRLKHPLDGIRQRLTIGCCGVGSICPRYSSRRVDDWLADTIKLVSTRLF
jgi:hypothetical protein